LEISCEKQSYICCLHRIFFMDVALERKTKKKKDERGPMGLGQTVGLD
jgi:hypothetical protein